MSTITYGSKYSKGVDVAEIAKSVRADIKAAIKAGELPAIKVGVTVSRYAGGRSLRLNVTACPVDIMNPARVLADAANPHAYPTIRETYNEAGRDRGCTVKGRHTDRTRSGQYRKTHACDACGKPVGLDFATDSEVCGDSDDPGFYLCSRKRCEFGHIRAVADVEARRAHYTRTRAGTR